MDVLENTFLKEPTGTIYKHDSRQEYIHPLKKESYCDTEGRRFSMMSFCMTLYWRRSTKVFKASKKVRSNQ